MVIELGKPQEKQKEFLLSKQKYVAYGGSRGGGKSWALRFKLKMLCLVNPGIRCLLIRRTYAELMENHIRVLRSELPLSVALYRDKDKSFEFVNGSLIKLGYCDTENDVLQYQGQEYDIIAIDEATQLTEFQFQIFKANLRGANDFPKRMYLTCNPGGVGHAWVKRLFIDREFKTSEDPNEYVFIPAKVYDNKILMEKDPGYIKNLESLPEDLRKAWLSGDWNVFDGQFFKEFDEDVHVCDPFEIPEYWLKYRAFDYGLDMLACLWVAVDTEGNSYVYRELNKSNLIVSEAAERILRMTDSDEKIYETYAPTDMWSRQKDSGKSMAEIFEECGLDIVRASRDRVQGWLQVKELLCPREIRNAVTGEITKRSKLVIFSTCKQLIKNIPLLQCDRRNVNDASTEPHDVTHNTDALRYYCISRYSAAKEAKEVEQTAKDKFFKQLFGNKRRIRW